jgi:quinol monooxygenase YgiN
MPAGKKCPKIARCFFLKGEPSASQKPGRMIYVVAVITAKSGRREELLAAVKENLPAVLAEEGCVEYSPVVDAEGFGKFQAPIGPDTMIMIEKWASPEALAAHARAPHMVAYAAKTKDLLAERAIHILTAA